MRSRPITLQPHSCTRPDQPRCRCTQLQRNKERNGRDIMSDTRTRDLQETNLFARRDANWPQVLNETFSRRIFHETNGAKLTSALTLFQRLCNELTIRARVRQATVRIPVPRRNVVDSPCSARSHTPSSQCGPRVNNDCTSCLLLLWLRWCPGAQQILCVVTLHSAFG